MIIPILEMKSLWFEGVNVISIRLTNSLEWR